MNRDEFARIECAVRLLVELGKERGKENPLRSCQIPPQITRDLMLELVDLDLMEFGRVGYWQFGGWSLMKSMRMEYAGAGESEFDAVFGPADKWPGTMDVPIRADKDWEIKLTGLRRFLRAQGEQPGDSAEPAKMPEAGPLVGNADTPPGEPNEGAKSSNPDLAPSRTKARALYEWAMRAIPSAENMTRSELFDAIQNHADFKGDMLDWLPPSADTFGRYLREAGIKVYGNNGDRVNAGSSIRRQAEI